MPYSYGFFKEEVRIHFLNYIPSDCKILDVGPGSATYSKLLTPVGYKLDAIEIWEPYIEQFKLKEAYQKVILGDIVNFDYSCYGYIILGDVLEHLSKEQATELIKNITNAQIKCLVAVPYLFEQGEYDGNEHETHLQPDLTPLVMSERYKDLTFLFGNNEYGYYINYQDNKKTIVDKLYGYSLYFGYKVKNKIQYLLGTHKKMSSNDSN